MAGDRVRAGPVIEVSQYILRRCTLVLGLVANLRPRPTHSASGCRCSRYLRMRRTGSRQLIEGVVVLASVSVAAQTRDRSDCSALVRC